MTPVTSLGDCEVVIVNYNAGSLLVDCVASVLDAGARGAIVVDNASRDGSIAALRDRFEGSSKLCILSNSANLGFAAACNIGLQRTTAERILFLNPDSVLDEGTLELMLEALDSAPGIGMVGGFLCDPDGSEQRGGRRAFPTPGRAFLRAFGLTGLARRFSDTAGDFLLHEEALPSAPVAVDAVSGACMLVKRQAVEDVGGWDEGYFLHCEDLDWCKRFALKGWTVMFVPQARVLHQKGACSRRRPFFVEWHKHRGMLRFYATYDRHRYPLVLWGLVVIGVWLRFALVCGYHVGRLVSDRVRGSNV